MPEVLTTIQEVAYIITLIYKQYSSDVQHKADRKAPLLKEKQYFSYKR